ncbi:MAG: LamG-like jellyroll fold domain-containing protein, partial [Candidatus Hermodarchaeota archaeon]
MNKTSLDLKCVSFPEFNTKDYDDNFKSQTQFMEIFRQKKKEFLQIISTIKKNYYHMNYYLTNIDSKILNLDSNIGRIVGEKHSRVEFYSDPKSREQYEEKLYNNYKENLSESGENNASFRFNKKSYYKFEQQQRELLREFFNNPPEKHFENLCVKIIKKITGYNESVLLQTFIYKKTTLKQFSLKIGSRNLNFQIRGNFFKKELKNQQKKFIRDLQKKEKIYSNVNNQNIHNRDGFIWKFVNNPKLVISLLLKTIPVLGLLFFIWFFSSSSSLLISQELISQFLFLAIVFYFSFLIFITKNRILTQQCFMLLLITSISLPVFLISLISINWFDFASLFIPIYSLGLCIVSYFATLRQIACSSKEKKHKILQKIAKVKYHQIKFPLLWFFLFIFTVSLFYVFIMAPQLQYVPVICIIVSILFFTVKAKHIKRKLISFLQKKKNKNSNSQGSKSQESSPQFEDRNVRAVLLIIIFLTCYPLVFGISSLVKIESPEMNFAKIPNYDRIKNSVDYTTLEFYSSLESLESISINDKFVIKCQISPLLGESVIVQGRLIPKDIIPIDGFNIKDFYSVSSRYVSGPLKNRELLTHVSLDKLNLAPGEYQFKLYYNVLTGFGFRTALPKTYDFIIEKDNLEILPTKPYDLGVGVNYGAVYTFDNEDSWKIVFNGQLTNSLHEGIQTENLTIYLENNNQWEEITTIATKENGSFYYEYEKFGSFGVNTLAKIEYAGDDFHKPLVYEEYAGLEFSIDGGRFFIDEDGDGYPEWPFSLYDILNALNQQDYYISDFLDFFAEFNDGFGSITHETIHDFIGTLEGNTTWTNGIRDYGLIFDGDGNIANENLDYIQFGDILDHVFGTSNNKFVVTGWLFLTSLALNTSDHEVQNTFFSKNGSLEFGISEEGYLQVYINTQNTEATGEYGTFGGIAIDTWTYIAVRYNDGDVDVLVNDIWYTSAIGTAEPWNSGGSLANGTNIIVGAELNNCTSFNGRLDEISVFNQSISNNDIEHHGLRTIPKSLDFHAKFEECIGSSTFDAVHNYEGTLNGDSVWASGYDGYGISFDGEGTITREGGSGGGSGFQIETIKVSDVDQASWVDVIFQNTYIEAVVIGTLEVPGGFDPDDTSVGARIRSVTSTGCQVKVAVPDYNFGTNSTCNGNIYLLVVEAGQWEESGWPKIEAGNHYTEKVNSKSAWGSPDEISLNTTFWGSTIARFMTSVITENSSATGSKWIESWTSNGAQASPPTTSGFYLGMNSAECNPQDNHPGETISYIVIEDGNFNVNGLHIKVGRTADTIEEYTHNNLVSHGFGATPIWGVAQQIAMDGGDGSWANWEDNPFTSTQIEPYTQEDRYDSETGHTSEEIDYIISNTSSYSYSAIISGEIIYENFDYVNFGDILDPIFDRNEFTVMGWVNPISFKSNTSSNGVKNVFLSKGNILELGINESGYFQIYLNPNNVAEATAEYGVAGIIPTNQWTFIAIRYFNGDVDVMIGNMWYKSALGDTPEPWSGGSGLSNGADFIVGVEFTDYSCFKGTLDEIMVHNRSLTFSEIKSIGHEFELQCMALKENGAGGWTPITTSGEIIDGYVNFECDKIYG